MGDDTTNDVFTLQEGVYQDAGGPLVRQASAFIKIEEGQPRCDNLVLHCVTGVGNAVDPGSVPMAEMRYSDDQGRTFGKWRAAPIGPQGVYPSVWWSRLGTRRMSGDTGAPRRPQARRAPQTDGLPGQSRDLGRWLWPRRRGAR
ncbi:MAG: hypothetical protein JOZ27_05135 [Caulobacteraceae bacterium]|nr:hypothetical protein [Caulobacteraceae bacterium]